MVWHIKYRFSHKMMSRFGGNKSNYFDILILSPYRYIVYTYASCRDLNDKWVDKRRTSRSLPLANCEVCSTLEQKKMYLRKLPLRVVSETSFKSWRYPFNFLLKINRNMHLTINAKRNRKSHFNRRDHGVNIRQCIWKLYGSLSHCDGLFYNWVNLNVN